MLEFLPSARDVIALQITGKLDHDSALHLIEVLEAAVSANDKTHVFAEMIDFSGMDFAHVPQYIGRAVPFLGKLTRLGRVAVVSDQAWLRALARLESAILPHVSYETFTSQERERALAWVEGSGALHEPAIKVIETSNADVLGFEIDGKLTRQEIEAAVDYFGARLEDRRPIRMLGRIRSLGGGEIAGFIDRDFLQMKLRAFSNVERYALVGGPPRLAGWIPTLDSLVKAELRHFEMADEARAWEWLGAEPRSERALSPDADAGPVADHATG